MAWDIGEILSPACGSLVLDERRAPDYRDPPAFQFETRSFGNSFVESDAVSAIQHVDAPGRQPNLQDATVSGKIFCLDLKVTQWRSKVGESSVNAFRIVGVGAEQHVHVLGSAWMAMKCNRMASDEYEFRTHIRKL